MGKGRFLARLAIGSLAVLILAYGSAAAAHHHDLDHHSERLDHTCFVCETTCLLGVTGATVVAPVAPSSVAICSIPAPPLVATDAGRRPDTARAPPSPRPH